MNVRKRINKYKVKMKQLSNNLFYIGVIILSLTLFAEHLFLGETNFSCFLKGFAAGIQLVGVIVLIRNKWKKEGKND